MFNVSFVKKIGVILFLAISVFSLPQLSYGAGSVHLAVHRFVPHWTPPPRLPHARNRAIHYSQHPRVGSRVAFLPKKHLKAQIAGENYYYYDGLYYNRPTNKYVIVPPPLGALVPAIPEEFQPVVINGEKYYVHDGIYYENTPDGFYIVPFPIIINGETYYVHNGTFYIENSDELQVVPPPIGAVVPSIPRDFKPILINGETYYTHNGIFYQKTSDGYQVVRAPAAVNQAAPTARPSPKTGSPDAGHQSASPTIQTGTETVNDNK